MIKGWEWFEGCWNDERQHVECGARSSGRGAALVRAEPARGDAQDHQHRLEQVSGL